MDEPTIVLKFWFRGEPGRFRKDWFRPDPAFDAAIREQFGETWEAARRGELEPWEAEPKSALALQLVLDQFPRNIHRGTSLAFATDREALRLARSALAQGFDRALVPVERLFFYLPFEHSEKLGDQERSVLLCEALVRVAPGLGGPDGIAEFARRHREVIRRFGRFPHRNRVLGRPSTPEEIAYLNEPGSGF